MITISAPTYTAEDLTYRPLECSADTWESLTAAVRASAVLCDPLAYQLSSIGRSTATLTFSRTINWLAANTVFAESGLLCSDAKWLRNVTDLASKLVTANYNQGWHGGGIFTPKYEPVAGELDSRFYGVRLKRTKHWPLYIQAVMTQQWVNAVADGAMAGQERNDVTYEIAKTFLWGAPRRLAHAYPVLGGESDEHFGSLPICTDEERAHHFWHENILIAANKFGASLTTAVTA